MEFFATEPFKGLPEYEFEVLDFRLLETEGVKLAQLVKPKTRRSFWEMYRLAQDAEAVRKILKEKVSEDKDYVAYQKLFSELGKKLSVKLIELEQNLNNELTLLSHIRL